MGGRRVCEVCGINESVRGGFFASFPLDENRCRTWVKIVGKEDLVYLPIEKLHKIRFICGDHFEKRDFNKKGTKLKKRAYPKLNLLAAPLDDEQMRDFPLHVASKTVSVSDPATPGTSRGHQGVLEESNINVSVRGLHQLPGTSRQQQPLLVEPLTVAASGQAISGTSRKEEAGLLERNINVSDPATPGTSRGHQGVLQESNINVLTNPKKRHCEPTEDVDVKRMKRDFNERELQILEQLKETKSTLRSMRKIVKDMEELEFPVLRELVSMAITNKKRKPRGRRWTTKHKVSWLSIYKRSPKVYRYLQHVLPLPSVKTLQNILKKVPMGPGVNSQVLEHLTKIAKKKQEIDRNCCLLFDEIALKPGLYFNLATDQVEGYTDLGNSERSSNLADHALVLMIQGLRQKMKQPLAFYFVKGTVSSHRLATIIQGNISAVNKTGFNVMATVCDQGPTNMGAISILKKLAPAEPSGVQNYFHVGGKKIYIIFDVPHLFKSIRNNFLNYDIMEIGGKVAQWQHLPKVQKLNTELLYLSKITEVHVQPKYRAKMKVKYAAQLLSNTVAAVLKLMAKIEENPAEAREIMQTGEVIHELDRLFDKTNGPSGPADIKKGQRTNVSATTDHVTEWAQFRKKMETVKFVKAGTGVRATNVRCVQGYITTLCSLRDLWSDVQSLGFEYLNLRQVNQDALENLFGILRQHSPTNSHPTVSNFISALKTAVISKLTAPHSRGSNCEKDGNDLMTDFHDLIFESAETKNVTQIPKTNPSLHATPDSNKENVTCNEAEYFLSLPEEEEETETQLISLDKQPIVYVSGFIASHILKKNKCSYCKKTVSVENPGNDPTYNYIQLREWWENKKSLTYPTIGLCRAVEKCVNIFENEVIPVLYTNNISNLSVTLFITKCDTSFLKCVEHSARLSNTIYNRLATLLIRRQCQRVNTTLSTQIQDISDKAKKAQQFGVDKNLV